MTVTALIDNTGQVGRTALADGVLLRLAGRFGDSELPALRLSLMSPIAGDCRDVVIDAGELTDVCDDAIAILVAARDWTEHNGARLLLSRSAPALDQALAELDLTDALPRLSPLAGAVPAPRPSLR